MMKRWPVYDMLKPTSIVEAPQHMVDYDGVQITVKLIPFRNGEPIEHVGISSRVNVSIADQRAVPYLAKQMLESLLKEWMFPER